MSLSIFLGFVAAVLGSFAGILLKRGSLNIIFKGFFNRELLFSLFLYFCSVVFFVIALNLGKLYIIYGLAAVNYSLTSVIGMFYFKEQKSFRKFLGIFFVIVGIVILGV
jgi:multidrug transporter EmrE-like cation transporter